MAAQPSPHVLVLDELHVLVRVKTERHYEQPGATPFARGRIDDVGAGAEAHLHGFAGCESETHHVLRELLAADLGEQSAHARVVPGKTVFTHA